MIVMLYSALVILVCALVMASVRQYLTVHKARRNGKLPPRGKATMFDVRHLLMEGEKDLALQLYCEIFNTFPAKAKKDIAELERSLKV